MPKETYQQSTSRLKLNVNRKELVVEAQPDTPLLWVIRDNLGLTGTKYGCGIARCGACTVHVDGKAVRSCRTRVSDVVGKEIVKRLTGSPRMAQRSSSAPMMTRTNSDRFTSREQSHSKNSSRSCLRYPTARRSSFIAADPMRQPLPVRQQSILKWDTRMSKSSVAA